MHRIPSFSLCITLVQALSAVAPAQAQHGTVLSHQKISDTEGGFTGDLDGGDQFGKSVASLGDLDGDGVGDLAVGAFSDDDGGFSRGAVWILFLNPDGTVKSHQKISDTEGGFTGALDDSDRFGWSVDSLGDLDGDGTGDLAVGAHNDDDGGIDRGAVWVLFLNENGTVKSHQKISSTNGGFALILNDRDNFGSSVAALSDLDGDGMGDLAVGAPADDDGGFARGAVWILFLNADGTIKSHQKISDTQGGFNGILDDVDHFGLSVASLSDLDGDGVGDLAVGAEQDDDGGFDRGAVWVLFLNTDGTVKSHQKISNTEGSFTGTLNDDDEFGRSVASLGDLDGDRVTDLAVGAIYDDDGSPGPCDEPLMACNRGAVWVLFLNPEGTVKSHQKISDTEGGFTGILDDLDHFGVSVASPGDFDGDGLGDLAVGAFRDDDGGANHGAVWVLFLDGVPQANPLTLDIKPGSCPNPFNRHGNGVLPVALVGTVEFDPAEVDLSTLQLSRADGVGGSVAPNEGPPGPHSVLEDVATPVDGEGCECHDLGGDGMDDLSMRFRTDELVEALELDALPGGAVVELLLSGGLLDGTPFVATDCIVIVPSGDLEPISATVGSNVGDTFIEVTPLDLNIDSDGFTGFGRAYYPGTLLTVAAPPTTDGRRFVRWMVDGVLQQIGVRTIEVTVAEDTALRAIYHHQRPLRPDRPTESDEPLD